MHRPYSSSATLPLRPVLAVCVGIATFGVMDALMKDASLAVGAFSAMLVRSWIGAGLMLPVWRLGGGAIPGAGALRLHALRGAVSAGMATSFFWALVRLPLAEAIAISFIAPLIALYLAAAILHERVARRAIFATLLGFAGVIVIAGARLRGGAISGDAARGIGAVLFSAVLYAFNLMLQRKQAQLAPPREVALFQSLFCALWLSLAAPWLMVWPAPHIVAVIVGAASLAVVSLMLLSWGYGRAETQVLLPIEYTAFVWAALMGWLMFGERVGPPTLVGVVLIVIGCWIAARGPTEQSLL